MMENSQSGSSVAGNSARPGAAPFHVLTLTPFFPSLENEVNGCFVKEPLNALARLGVSSSVIAASPIHSARRSSGPSAPAEWVRYFQIPGTAGLSSAGRFLYARLRRDLAELHSRRPIHVIHAHAALPCGHAARLLGRHLRIPYVVTVHGLDVFNSCFRAGAPAEWRRRASIEVYRSAASVICVSRKVQEILQAGMPGEVRSAIVYNGTDTDLFSPPLLHDSISSSPLAGSQEILIVGNLIPSKGQELVLQAVGRLADSFPQLQCHIIGEGPDRTRLETLANQIGIRERIHFAGRQSRTAVAEAMRRCTVFALPSSSEGLGCVYLEAMACVKPVIACRGQGIEEIIEHGRNGRLISPDNVDELTDALSNLLSSRERSLQIGAAARQTVLNGLTLDRQAHNLATLYRAVAVLGAVNRAL